MRCTTLRYVFIALAAIFILAAFSPVAWSQAWTPPRGEGAVSFMFQDQYYKYHMLPTQKVDIGAIRARSLLVNASYGLTDKIAVSVGMPWIATKYNGSSPHPLADFSGTNAVDNGNWHAAAQDFHFDVRYNVTHNLLGQGIVLTPYVAATVPSNDYVYFAHAGYGRQIKEVQTGVAAAKLFNEPGNLLVQARYGYGVAEEVVGFRPNRSVGSVEVGYFVKPRVRLMALSSGQRTHGGIDLTRTARATLPTEQFLHHDQISRENSVSVGAGVSYSLTQTVDVYGSWMKTVTQRNGHLLDRGISIGVSWSYSTRRGANSIARAQEQSLVRCLCEKSAN
jgi:hypothetical protein